MVLKTASQVIRGSENSKITEISIQEPSEMKRVGQQKYYSGGGRVRTSAHQNRE
jgi:hypothetical protein